MEWVVCYNLLMQPSTWGRVLYKDTKTVEIEYGKDAPHWFWGLWRRDFVKFYNTEDEAKSVVLEYNKYD